MTDKDPKTEYTPEEFQILIDRRGREVAEKLKNKFRLLVQDADAALNRLDEAEQTCRETNSVLQEQLGQNPPPPQKITIH